MAVANQTLQDSRYRVIVKTTTTSTNTAASILDVSGLVGFVAVRTSLVTIAKILKYGFQIAVIPQTLRLTNLIYLKEKDLVKKLKQGMF